MALSKLERSKIAKKAVATREANQAAKRLSEIALKAVATRQENEAKMSKKALSAKRTATALKAWETRRAG
jgi:hypothetical protein